MFAGAGSQGVHKRPGAEKNVYWHVATRPCKRKAVDPVDSRDAFNERVERLNAGVRAKVENPFRVVKRKFGHVKVRDRRLAKNTAQVHMLFAPANLWQTRRQLLGATV